MCSKLLLICEQNKTMKLKIDDIGQLFIKTCFLKSLYELGIPGLWLTPFICTYNIYCTLIMHINNLTLGWLSLCYFECSKRTEIRVYSYRLLSLFYAHTHTHTYISTYADIYIYVYIYICTHIYKYICRHICICIYICIYIYEHTHTQTHICT